MSVLREVLAELLSMFCADVWITLPVLFALAFLAGLLGLGVLPALWAGPVLTLLVLAILLLALLREARG
jgi:hypothetical protein